MLRERSSPLAALSMNPRIHAHQDDPPLWGFKRHVRFLDELAKAERLDYIQTLCRIRKAQREMLGVDRVYHSYLRMSRTIFTH